MKTAVSLIAVAAIFAVNAPAFAAGVKFNAQGMTPVAQSARGNTAGDKEHPHLAYSYTRGFGTDRSFNVLGFSTPSTGIYCIQPIKAVTLTSVYPLVSIEWGNSSGESLQAFWVDTSHFTDCAAGDFEVRTYDISTGTSPVLTANVAFDIVVP